MRHHHKPRHFAWPTSRLLKAKARKLFGHPIFFALTVFGNLVILLGALALYYLESGVNPHIDSLLDTVWWAVTTVTTVGYGDVSPVTTAGKVIGIFMMLVGTALFCSYTGLFAQVLISDELDDFNSELQTIESRLNALRSLERANDPDANEILNRIDHSLRELAQSRKR